MEKFQNAPPQILTKRPSPHRITHIPDIKRPEPPRTPHAKEKSPLPWSAFQAHNQAHQVSIPGPLSPNAHQPPVDSTHVAHHRVSLDAAIPSVLDPIPLFAAMIQGFPASKCSPSSAESTNHSYSKLAYSTFSSSKTRLAVTCSRQWAMINVSQLCIFPQCIFGGTVEIRGRFKSHQMVTVDEAPPPF